MIIIIMLMTADTILLLNPPIWYITLCADAQEE